jgi:hypothetical protein
MEEKPTQLKLDAHDEAAANPRFKMRGTREAITIGGQSPRHPKPDTSATETGSRRPPRPPGANR